MFQYQQGRHTTQGHKGIPDGLFEEEQGRKGFFGPVSHLLRPSPSTRWSQIEGPLRPHLFDGVKLEKHWGQWQRMFFNSDVGIHMQWLPVSHPDREVTEAFRNADGDTLYFVHAGRGVLLSEYGALSFERGHYLNMPKCVAHAWSCSEETQLLVVESKTGSYREPDRGMVGRNAFYDLAALGKPDLSFQNDWVHSKKLDIRKIHVKRRDQITRFDYPLNAFDVVGWKGDFFPFSLHVRDLMPLLSARVHLPPSAHTTFVSQNFVVCTFLPRPLETDADALKVPFYHQNIDYDEVLFYHDGNFFSRDNLHAGMMTLHPAGFPHGPHPKAVKGIGNKTHTDEYAVMIDTWNALEIDERMSRVEVSDYWNSWNKK